MAKGPLIPARYIFTALVSIGLAIIYGLKVNLSVAIVVMINSTELALMASSESQHNSHHVSSNGTGAAVPEFACQAQDSGNKTVAIQDGPFAWPEPVQGLVLSAYFWGYLLTQIPGGMIAEKYSAKWVIWASVLVNVVFTILTPVASNISYIAVLVVRFIEGLGAGVSLPAIHVMLTKWVLPQERNLMSSLAYAGMALGTVISLPFSGVLAAALGWEAVFYVQGGLAMIWCVLWIVFVFDSPDEHPRIHPVELELFEAAEHHDEVGTATNGGAQKEEEQTMSVTTEVVAAPVKSDEIKTKPKKVHHGHHWHGYHGWHGFHGWHGWHAGHKHHEHPKLHKEHLKKQGHHGGHGHANLPIPWKALATSGPFWAILVAHTCNNFGWYMLLVELPTYMKAILRFNISQNAGLSAIPYLCLWIFSIMWSNRLDWAKGKGWISTTTVRKLSTAVASLLPAACFVGVSLVGCDRQAAVALMTVGTMFVAGMYCGFLTNHVDIAPNYAGTLMALTNTAATIPGFIVPAFVGQLTHGNQTLGQWQIIFFTTAAVFVFEFIIYTVFASGEEQPWNHLVVDHPTDSSKDTVRGIQKEPETEQLDAEKTETA